MRSALDVHRELLERDVPHEVVRLRTRVLSADDLPRALGLDTGALSVRCYRTTAEDGTEGFAAVLVPAGAVPDPVALLDALGAAAARPATATEVNAVTDFAATLVCPVGLPPEVVLLADAAVGTSDVVYTAAGEGGVALGIRTRDLLVAVGARVAALTPLPAAGEDALSAGGVVVDLDRRRAPDWRTAG